MTVYRCVCPTCTAFIRSYPDESPEEWKVRCDEWLDGHICGQDAPDGVERPSEYERFAQ